MKKKYQAPESDRTIPRTLFWLVIGIIITLTIITVVTAADGDPSRFGNSTSATVWVGGTNGNVTALGNISANGNVYAGGSVVCTATNGLCGAAGANGGWINTTGTVVSLANSAANVSAGNVLIDNTRWQVILANGTFLANGTLNPAADYDALSNYPVQARRWSTTAGTSTGMAFSVTTSATVVGASIVFIRDSLGGGAGNLVFRTSNNSALTNEHLRITHDGNVSIGTSQALAKFIVNGSANITGNLTATGNITLLGGYLIDGRATNGDLFITGTTVSRYLRVQTTSTGPILTGNGDINARNNLVVGTSAASSNNITTYGFLGVATEIPTQRLSVNGSANITNITYISSMNVTGVAEFQTRPARCPSGNNTFTVDWAGVNQTCEQVNVSQFSFVANCPADQVVQNITTGGLQCVAGGGVSGGAAPAPTLAVSLWNTATTLTNGRLWWNTTAYYLGINTNTPGYNLDVNGTVGVGGRADFFSGINVTSGRSTLQDTSLTGKLNVTSDLNASGTTFLNIRNCNTIDTNANGELACGTDEGSGSSGANITAGSFADDVLISIMSGGAGTSLSTTSYGSAARCYTKFVAGGDQIYFDTLWYEGAQTNSTVGLTVGIYNCSGNDAACGTTSNPIVVNTTTVRTIVNGFVNWTGSDIAGTACTNGNCTLPGAAGRGTHYRVCMAVNDTTAGAGNILRVTRSISSNYPTTRLGTISAINGSFGGTQGTVSLSVGGFPVIAWTTE